MTEPAASPFGGVWSGADVDAWAAEVEALEVLAVPPDVSRPVSVDVRLERV